MIKRIIAGLIGLGSIALGVFIKRSKLSRWIAIPLFVGLLIFGTFAFYRSTTDTPFIFADIEGSNSATADITTTSTCSDNMNWGGEEEVPARSTANDASYLTYNGNSWDNGNISDGLAFSNFGFSTSGTIDGIQVEIINWTYQGGAEYEDVILFTAVGTRVGNDKEDSTVAIPTSDPANTYTSWGGVSDTWGAGLSSAQVNASTFGVEFCWQATGNNSRANIDHVRITITYTPLTGEQQQQAYSVFNF